MTEMMLRRCKRWIHEQRRNENVETIRAFITEEAEFQMAAAETIHGFQKVNVSRQKNVGNAILFGLDQNYKKDKKNTKCAVCQRDHRIWQCTTLKEEDINRRWEIANKQKLCFQCLGSNHLSKACKNSRICGIDGCTDTQNCLLHKKKQKAGESNPHKPEKKHEGESVEGSHTSAIIKEPKAKNGVNYVSLRTVPVILRKGSQKIVVNALLDDGSAKTYINSDVAAELNLQGGTRKVTVNMLNGQVDSFETTPVEFELESLDGKVKRTKQATANRVTGSLKPLNWNSVASKWHHSKKIRFPDVGPKPTIDILIGVDYADLHCTEIKVKGKPNEPVARLTPLGWTCGGGINEPVLSTNFVTDNNQDLVSINNTIRKLWELEGDNHLDDHRALSPADTEALQIVNKH